LYLSLETATALAEYQQLAPLLPPGVIVAYQVKLEQVVDFRDGVGPGGVRSGGASIATGGACFSMKPLNHLPGP
jgi:hypothetical protein